MPPVKKKAEAKVIDVDAEDNTTGTIDERLTALEERMNAMEKKGCNTGGSFHDQTMACFGEAKTNLDEWLKDVPMQKMAIIVAVAVIVAVILF